MHIFPGLHYFNCNSKFVKKTQYTFFFGCLNMDINVSTSAWFSLTCFELI